VAQLVEHAQQVGPLVAVLAVGDQPPRQEFTRSSGASEEWET
jgi:hypothetical protein